jgi:hypothetical protein
MDGRSSRERDSQLINGISHFQKKKDFDFDFWDQTD